MAMQLPQQFNSLSLPAIDNARQQKEYNALKNDAQQQQNTQNASTFDEGQKLKAAQMFVGMSQYAKKALQQDPNAWAAILPEFQRNFQEIGLPTDKIPPAGSSLESIVEGLDNLERSGSMYLSGQPQEQITKNDLVQVDQDGRSVYTRAEDAVGQAAPSTSSTTSAPAKIQQAEWWMNANPDQRAGYMSANYAGKVQSIGGVPHWVMPGGDSIPLSTIEDETAGRSTIAAGVSGAQTQAQGEETRVQGLINQGQEVADSLPVLKRSMQLLETVNTGGKLAQAQLDLVKALGIETADQGELSANLGKAVLSQLRETFGAQFTEAEGQRLVAIEAGFSKNNKTNMRLLGQAVAIVEAKANRAIKLARANDDEATAQIIEDMLNMSLSPDSEAGGGADFQAQWDAAASGTVLTAPDGTQRRKP